MVDQDSTPSPNHSRVIENCGSSKREAFDPPSAPGTSKWNPIERGLFSEISKNWAGQPRIDMETMLNFIRTTKTQSGLAVTAYLLSQNYDAGIKISDAEMRQLNLVKHDTLGTWNYTLHPASNAN